MKALAFVTLSSATGPEKRMRHARVDAEAVQLVDEADLVAARGIDGAIGQRERHAAPGGLPRIGHGLPVRGEERLHLGGGRPAPAWRLPAASESAEREAAGEASDAAHRPQRGGWGDGWRGPGAGTTRRGTRGAAW